jgi:hypothetical protein
MSASSSEEPPTKKVKIEDSSTTHKPSVASLLRKDNVQLSRFHKWCPQDDLLLKNAAERGLAADEIAEQIKFQSSFTADEILDRWKALLYDNDTAKTAAKQMITLEQTSTKRVPWTEEENAIIIDELKKKRYLGFQQLMDKYRDEFHPCRTVKSLEAHFYRLKRNGVFDEIDHLHGLTKNTPGSTNNQTIDEVEDEIFNENFEEPEEEPAKKVRKNQEKRDSKAATKLEKELAVDKHIPKKRKRKQTTKAAATEIKEEAVAEPQATTEQYESTYIFALLDGAHTLMRITNEETLIGRQTASNKVDVDLALEGDAGKASRKQGILKITAVASTDVLTTVATGTEDQKKQVKVLQKPGRMYEALIQLQNIGKRDILVDGTPVKSGATITIQNDSTALIFPGNLQFNLKINRNDVNQWLADYELIARSRTAK